MPDNTKATYAVLRALLDEMAKSLAAPKPVERDPNQRTRVNVKEFNKAQGEEEGWWDSSSDGDALIGLRPPRKRRGPRPRR